MSSIVDQQRAFFEQGSTLSYRARINALNRFDQGLRQCEDDIIKALYNDFQKSAFESFTTEFTLLYQEISRTKRLLKSWMKPQNVRTNWIN